jgi:hypothetical protein
MTDVERWPEWTASISDVECLGGGPFDVGSQFRVRQPRLPVAVWTVTVLEKNRYFEWQALAPGLRSMGGHRVDAMSLNSARVTLTLNWSGWLAPLIRLLYAGLARRYVETEAAGLKRRCEAP